ncbi:MAG: chemotaxis protein CheW [Verrucomicrobiales bacterium]|nr:chemotaxis protein CheW [Verrucomicrobiales bacterium]
MSQPRNYAPPEWEEAYYHCFSRILEGQRILGPAERSEFRHLMREYEAFCGVQVLTYCVMSNHFHILVAVPRPPDTLPTADELLARFDRLTGSSPAPHHRQVVEIYRAQENRNGEAQWCATVARRLWNVSEFIKAIKQRFTQWHNRRQGRRGTLWEGRFGSVLVEGAGRALAAMAAYIDLNPVRAGLTTDPKEYSWSGYGSAMAGDPTARRGLQRLAKILCPHDAPDVPLALEHYRMHLYRQADPSRESIGPDGRTLRATLPLEAIREVIQHRGKLPLIEYVHCRVRYFCEGVFLGTRPWVESLFRYYRRRFSPRRRSGARRMSHLAEGGLYTARELRKNVIQTDSS